MMAAMVFSRLIAACVPPGQGLRTMCWRELQAQNAHVTLDALMQLLD